MQAKTERIRRQVKPIAIAVTDDTRRILEKWGQKPVTPQQYVFDVLKSGMDAEREMMVFKQFVK